MLFNFLVGTIASAVQSMRLALRINDLSEEVRFIWIHCCCCVLWRYELVLFTIIIINNLNILPGL